MSGKGLFGVGLGLRRPHILEAAERADLPVPFWEVAPENIIGEGGRIHRAAMEVLARDPALSHGLSLSPGGYDGWDLDYLRDLGAFLQDIRAPWHSEHLCFTVAGGVNTHELLPIPFTRAAAAHTVQRVRALQDALPVPLILENITYYAELGAAEMEEADFITAVLEGADCGWLLDVSNVYVNSLNFGFDPRAWIARMPLERVRQIHVGGYEQSGEVVIDTHGATISDPVIALLQWTLARLGRNVPVLLERDHQLPDLDVLLVERTKLQDACDEALLSAGTGGSHA
ncbi:DUF692 domain-containing protein [Geothrix fermentans]|uniref:DUF692 domain-containing protein n=1 Tax=Geothrix fermentans TaxID=44676 RepID=UPI00041D09E7|nr:DUF692 domain-containing protein [Geothrix fermentans]